MSRHGRDSQLYVWKLIPGVDVVLPVDRHANPDMRYETTPSLCHSMTVNTLNFCAFTWTRIGLKEEKQSYLLALPHTLSSEAIDIFLVIVEASEAKEISIEAIRRTTIPAPELDNPKTGLTMCLAFSQDADLLAGYESGHTIAYHRATSTVMGDANVDELTYWTYGPSYISRPHSQPILSIRNLPGRQIYITTAADSKLVTHLIPDETPRLSTIKESKPYHVLDTKHSGQQGLSVRNDGLLLATAGWDSKGRVYKSPLLKEVDGASQILPPKELAVLKWHKEGCYCTAFAHLHQDDIAGQRRVAEEFNDTGEQTPFSLVKKGFGQIETATRRRDHKARNTHWLSLGSKDGKISLWDIF